jgi:hypothetical protein
VTGILILFLSEIITKISCLHQPAAVGLPFGHERVPTYEFYDLALSRALVSRGVAYPFHE